MQYKTALVTGGAGFIGSHMVDELIRRRIKVYVIDDLSTGSKANVNPNAQLFKVNITAPALPALIKRLKPDVIFHLAAQADVRVSVEDPVEDAQTNILGSLALMHAAEEAGTKKFIFTSTGGAMFSDEVRPPYSEATPAAPVSPYGISKRAAELYLEYFAKRGKMATVCIRPANAFGPRQGLRGEAGVISVFARRMVRGQEVTINGDGKNTRDYVYVSDIVNAHMLAMQKNVTGIYHIGSGREVDVNTLFRKLNKLIGGKMTEVHGPAKKGEVRRSALNSRKAEKELGWKPKVSFDEGLKKTVVWFSAYKK